LTTGRWSGGNDDRDGGGDEGDGDERKVEHEALAATGLYALHLQ